MVTSLRSKRAIGQTLNSKSYGLLRNCLAMNREWTLMDAIKMSMPVHWRAHLWLANLNLQFFSFRSLNPCLVSFSFENFE